MSGCAGRVRDHGLQERHALQRRPSSARHDVRVPDGRERAHPPNEREPAADRQGCLMADFRPATPDQAALLSELVDHRLLIETGVPGLYGRGDAFVRVCQSFAALISRAGEGDNPERMCFPPLPPRSQLGAVGYLKSSPNLGGSVFTFEVAEAQAAEQHDRASKHEYWSEF